MSALVTMDQGLLFHPHLPVHAEYSLPSENECIDQYPGHHPVYASTGPVEQLRRHANLPQHEACPTFTSTNHPQPARFVADRNIASDVNGCQPAQHFPDSSTGSISTSPSSAASSIAYTSYPANHYTSNPHFPGTVQLPQAFIPGPYAGPRASAILDGAAMLPPPTRSPITNAHHPNDRDLYASPTPFATRNQLSPTIHSTYTSFADTPRNLMSGAATLPLSPSSAVYSAHAHMAAAGGYGTHQSECATFPWPNLEVLVDLTCEGQQVTPEVQAKVEKGFFLSTVDQKWTCYRRNYFSVQCHFELHPHVNNARMYLKRNNNSEMVQAMGMRLSAAVDGSPGKAIELIQHTPKRDNGPKTKIDVTKVSPTPSAGRSELTVSPHRIYQIPAQTFHPVGASPGPYLPLQSAGEHGASSSHAQTSQVSSQFPYAESTGHLPLPGQNTTHTFERVQFKQATANNGKRRASQQYFHLTVELFADVRKDGGDTPVWIKVAQRISEKIVVRGRSPSHYQNEGQHGPAGRGGSASGGSGYTAMTGPGYGTMNAGAFRSSTGAFGAPLGGAEGFRTHPHTQPPSEHSGSSPESVDDRVAGGDQPMGNAPMTDGERASFQEYEGYQYYPGGIYDGVPQQLPPLAMIEGPAKYSTKPREFSLKAEYAADSTPGPQWQMGNCSRFQGVGSSRDYFPDLSAGYS